jgi:anti-sigma28 factor (negative regulator of flagellin synthesis)
MRIDPKVVLPPIGREPRESPPSIARTSDSGSSGASVVKLSTAGAAVSAETGPAAPTTTARLQTIRAMLDKGDYPVDLDALASRIVDDELVRAGRSS